MFNFNSYSKLRYWLRERIILWGLGCLRVGALERWRVIGRWNDLVLEGSRVGELYGRFRIGQGKSL